MDLHFAVRLLIILVALSCFLTSMLRGVRLYLPSTKSFRYPRLKNAGTRRKAAVLRD
jgi:hypothetical protein